MTDRIELRRLVLQIERDLVVRASLRTLLAAADATVVGHRQELQAVNARVKRDTTKPPEPFPAMTPPRPTRAKSPGQGRNG